MASPGFIAEFHARLDMKIIRVSIGWRSAAWASPIRRCIRPWMPRGASHEKARSSRSASPCSSTSRSSGPCGSPSGGVGSEPSGFRDFPPGGGAPAIGCGNGDLYRHEPGVSTAPISICRRWIARQVWNPLEWAEMPRIAWIANGRGRKTATRGHGFGREFGRQITFGSTGECWLRRSSIRKSKRAEKSGVGTDSLGIHEVIRAPIVGERLALFIPGEEPMIGVAGSVDCQIMCIGIANKKVQIDLASLEQAMNQSENQYSIGAGRDADELVRDRGV